MRGIEETFGVVELAEAPSVRGLSCLAHAGLGEGIGVTDPYTAAAQGILASVATIGQSVPSIAAAFGQNKQVKEQNKLAQQALSIQAQAQAAQAQNDAISAASWAETARTVAPYVGGAVLLAGAAWGISRFLKRGRR